MVLQISGAKPVFTRLAVTPEQALRMHLPSAPAKATDKRQFSGETVQCEAIAPDVLSGILRDAIEARRDPLLTYDALGREAEMRADLLAKLEGIA